MKFSRQAPSPSEFVQVMVGAMRGARPYHKSMFKFEPRDIWVGLYWNPTDIEYEYAKDFVRSTYRWRVDVFVCPVPCFLIRFSVELGKPRWKRGDMSNFNRGRDETNKSINAHKPLNMPSDRTSLVQRACETDDGSCSTATKRFQ